MIGAYLDTDKKLSDDELKSIVSNNFQAQGWIDELGLASVSQDSMYFTVRNSEKGLFFSYNFQSEPLVRSAIEWFSRRFKGEPEWDVRPSSEPVELKLLTPIT